MDATVFKWTRDGMSAYIEDSHEGYVDLRDYDALRDELARRDSYAGALKEALRSAGKMLLVHAGDIGNTLDLIAAALATNPNPATTGASCAPDNASHSIRKSEEAGSASGPVGLGPDPSCENCGYEHGSHSAASDRCPTPDALTPFHPTFRWAARTALDAAPVEKPSQGTDPEVKS